MAASLFPDHLVFVRPDQREPGLVTRGQVREKAYAANAAYVFDTLGYRRFEWKCNSLNEPSKRAAQRFGFTAEGVFRQHMIQKAATATRPGSR